MHSGADGHNHMLASACYKRAGTRWCDQPRSWAQRPRTHVPQCPASGMRRDYPHLKSEQMPPAHLHSRRVRFMASARLARQRAKYSLAPHDRLTRAHVTPARSSRSRTSTSAHCKAQQ